MGSVSQQSPKEGNQVDSSLGNNRSRKLEGWDCVLEPWGRRRGKCVCLGRRQGSSPEKQEQELNWEVHPRRKETDLQEARQMAGIRIWKAKLTGSVCNIVESSFPDLGDFEFRQKKNTCFRAPFSPYLSENFPKVLHVGIQGIKCIGSDGLLLFVWTTLSQWNHRRTVLGTSKCLKHIY